MGFIFVVLQNIAYMNIPRYIQLILDEVGQDNRRSVIVNYIWWVVLFVVIMTISLFLMRKLIIGVSRKIEYKLRKKIFNKIIYLDYDFFQKNETGDIVSRTTNDLNDVRMLLGPGILYIPNALTRILLFLPVLIGLSGQMMVVIGAMMIFLILLIVFLLPRLRPMFQSIQEQVAAINSRVWQTITGISTIKQYHLETIELNRFKKLNRTYIQANMKVVKFREFLWPFFLFTFALTELVILLVGGKMVIRGEMTLGQLMQFTMLITFLTFPVLSIGWVMSLMQQGISAMKRINYILHQPVSWIKEEVSITSDNIGFEIKNFSFNYPDQNEPTLKNISLSIKSGQTIGITGTIGSGKSTLLNILSGLFRPEAGKIFINDVDITTINSGNLSENMAIVSQTPFLFSRTIAENIAMGKTEKIMDLVEKAAQLADVEKDISTFAHGFDEMVGERGITLSGGQKQRLAIARALYKCTPILMLDDPLSHVDAQTETKILENLKKSQCYKTMILISHRISALKHADYIYVMDQGQVKEQGTHRTLMKEKGLYARLAKLQEMEI